MKFESRLNASDDRHKREICKLNGKCGVWRDQVTSHRVVVIDASNALFLFMRYASNKKQNQQSVSRKMKRTGERIGSDL